MDIQDTEDGQSVRVTIDNTPRRDDQVDLTLRLRIPHIERLLRSQHTVDLLQALVDNEGGGVLYALPEEIGAEYDEACEDLFAFTGKLFNELRDGLILGGHAINHRN